MLCVTGIPLQNQRSDGCTWLFLINGGEKSFEEEKVARDELKKIYQCFISNKLVKPEHVVCATGGTGKLFQHETITNVSKLSSVFPQISEPTVNPPQVNPTTQSLPKQQIPLKGKKKGIHTGLSNQGGGFNLGGTVCNNYYLAVYLRTCNLRYDQQNLILFCECKTA